MERAFPKKFIILGWLAYFPAVILILRFLWEKTLLTWEHGEQMVGFSVVHQYPIQFMLGLTALVICDIWVIVGSVYLYRRRAKVSRGDKIQFFVILFTLLIEYTPNVFWVLLGSWLGYVKQ